MKTVFISKLKPFLDAVAGEMELYVPKKAGEHYVFSRYEPDGKQAAEFNSIRTCVPVKEFLFPLFLPEPSQKKGEGCLGAALQPGARPMAQGPGGTKNTSALFLVHFALRLCSGP